MIVDRFGKEMKANKPIIEEIAVQTVRDRYSSYPSHGLTPQRLARIFKEADQGEVGRQAELFEEMEEKDLHLTGIMQSRKLAVTGLDWEMLPASDEAEDKKIAEAAKEMIEYIENLDDALLDILDAVGKGFSVGEIMWEISEGQIWAKTIEWVHQRRFTFNSPDALLKYPKLITDESPIWGEDLPANKFIVHAYKARSGATPRGGLLRPCAYMYLFKNYDIKDWLIFNELFSVPMRIGKYKPGATTKDIEALKQAVFNLGVDAAAVISESTMIEILESKVTGSNNSHAKFVEYCEKGMSKAVLGHTGNAEGTPGKLGSEKQASELRQDLMESDAKALMKTIKFQLLAPWVIFNYGPGKGVPIFTLHCEAEEDLEKTAKVYGTLVKDVNFEGIPESHIYERFGIPRPVGSEKTIKASGTGDQKQALIDEQKQIKNKGIMVMINAADIEAESADWVSRYMKALAPSVQSARQNALGEIEAWLSSLSSPPSVDEFVAHVEGILGTSLAAMDTAAITDSVTDIYLAYRSVPGITAVFGGPDIRSMQFLADVDHFYVSKFLNNPDAQATVRDFLSRTYLEKGANLFKRSNPEDLRAFRDLFGQKLADLEEWQVRRIIDTSVQRTRNWASVAQLNEARIAELVIYEPTKDCAFCATIDGKVISVSTAYNRMIAQTGMTPKEYEQDMRQYQATEDNIDTLINSGYLPPYHPHCHGTVLRRMS